MAVTELGLAHGECKDCDFVGDMYWMKDGKRVYAICPECNCTTDESQMPEHPGAKK